MAREQLVRTTSGVVYLELSVLRCNLARHTFRTQTLNHLFAVAIEEVVTGTTCTDDANQWPLPDASEPSTTGYRANLRATVDGSRGEPTHRPFSSQLSFVTFATAFRAPVPGHGRER